MTKVSTQNGPTHKPVTPRVRVGFLYNHDELHQVSHTAPIIAELQRQQPSFEVEVLAADSKQAAAAESHFDPDLPKPVIHLLQGNRLANAVEWLTGRALPVGRIGRLSANLGLLGSYDALVTPETTSTLLKTRFGLTRPRLIHSPHGAGDRSIAISPDIADFDFVLLPGDKTRDRMLASGIVRPADHAVVGYPKFDAQSLAKRQRLFANDRPTVLYNPHFDPALSSWFDFGIDILEYFARQDQYNLIVAPHVMLFQRRILASVEHRKLRFRRNIPAKYYDFDHIQIDTGSASSVDMTYTRNADIYVGDVSSQIYEFIERPGPAIFLNSHGAQWQTDPNYSFWNFGPVASDIGEFAEAMNAAVPLGNKFKQNQLRAFCETFSVNVLKSASSRAATAIADYLVREMPASRHDG